MNWLRPNLGETVKSLSMGLFKASFQLINQKGAGYFGENQTYPFCPRTPCSSDYFWPISSRMLLLLLLANYYSHSFDSGPKGTFSYPRSKYIKVEETNTITHLSELGAVFCKFTLILSPAPKKGSNSVSQCEN